MNDNQLETLKQLGDLGCYVAMDTRLCKVAYDEITFLRQKLAERDAELEEQAILNSAKAASVRRLHALTEQLAAKQAEVDALVLEYCPRSRSDWKSRTGIR